MSRLAEERLSGTSAATVLVWRYGARNGVTIPAEVERQLRLAHDLREELVAIVHRRERAIGEIWAKHPAVREAQRDVAQVETALDHLLDAATAERIQRRRRTVSAELRKLIKEARAARRDAKQRERDAKADVYASLTPALYAARDAERAQRKETYVEFVQRRGLYWATYNAVMRSHTAAVRRITAMRREGRPAALRHHRYEGTGRVAVQLQREEDDPVRTASLLASPASPWRGVLQIPAVAAAPLDEWNALSRSEQRKTGRVSIAVRVASNPDRSPVMWEIPIQVHRPVPPDAEVVGAEAVVKRVASQRLVSVNLTLRIPGVELVEGPAVAVDIGWRAMPDRSLRVAYWRAANSPIEPMRVPEHLAEVLIVRNGGLEGEIRVPASWRELHDRAATIRSGRDKDLERIKTKLVTWLEQHPNTAAALDLAPAAVKDWRAPRRMAALTRRLSEHPEAAEIYQQMRVWERQDRHLWSWEANETHQLRGRRRDAFAVAAAMLTRSYPHVILESRFAARLIRTPPTEETDSHQRRAARANAQLAAPAELADALRHAAIRNGGEAIEIDPSLTTRRHHRCGHQLAADVDTARHPIVSCPNCGMTFDQDANAVANMLREWSAAIKRS